MAIQSPDALSTWQASSFLQAIAQELQIAQAQNIVEIDATATGPTGSLASIGSYSLLLTDAATVGLTTAGGQTISVSLPSGYQPIRVSDVSSVSAGTAYALY